MRPDGSFSPKRTSTRASPSSCPANPILSTAFGVSIHVMSCGPPVFTTTMVFELARLTRSMSSTWSPGRKNESRSLPSVSQSSFVPTITTATSDFAARSSASWSRSLSMIGLSPILHPSISMAPSLENSISIGTSRPACRSISAVISADPIPKKSSPLP